MSLSAEEPPFGKQGGNFIDDHDMNLYESSEDNSCMKKVGSPYGKMTPEAKAKVSRDAPRGVLRPQFPAGLVVNSLAAGSAGTPTANIKPGRK